MKTYIIIHEHKHGNTPYMFRSGSLILDHKGLDKEERKIIAEQLNMDFDEHTETMNIMETGEWKDIPIIKF